MAYTRITAIWNGATGLPGYTRMKFIGDLDSGGAAAAAARMRAFFLTCAPLIPAAVNITFTEAAQVYDLQSNLTGEVPFTPPATVQGTASGSFSSPVGMVINWLTGAFSGGRKIRGRTFMVPLGSSAFAVDGSPGSGSVTTVQGAATTLLGGTPALVIQTTSPGTSNMTTVNGASVPKRSAVLRSRRD